MLRNSPIAIRCCLKAALNADCDGQAGLQELAGNATIFSLTMTEVEGQRRDCNAFTTKNAPQTPANSDVTLN